MLVPMVGSSPVGAKCAAAFALALMKNHVPVPVVNLSCAGSCLSIFHLIPW